MSRYVNIPPSSSGDAAALAWLATQRSFVTARDATITKVQFWSPCNQFWGIDRSAASGTGTADLAGISGSNNLKMRLTSGTTGNSFRTVRNRATAIAGGATIFDNLCANVRTSHWAVMSRVIVGAVNNTCTVYAGNMTDETTADCWVGVAGATSQTTFSLKIGAAAAVDSGVSVGTLGTTETDVVMWCDGTTVSANFNGNTTAAATGASNTAANAAGHLQLFAFNGATASNVSIDVLYWAAMSA